MNAAVSLYGWQWRGWAALLLAVAAALFIFVLFPAAARKSGSSDIKVVDLQRAFTPEMFGRVLLEWTSHGAEAVAFVKRENIQKLDFIFPAVYGLGLAFLYAFLSGRVTPSSRDFVFFAAPLVAALFDYAENLSHLRLLRGIDSRTDVQNAIAASSWSPSLIFAASVFAYAKYVLLLVSIGGIALVIVDRLRR